MGFRTAGARLGLGSATKMRSLWVCMRRGISSAAQKKKKSLTAFDLESNPIPNKKKAVHLCFLEFGGRYRKQSVCRIDDKDEKLIDLGYKHCDYYTDLAISSGSKILFPSGPHCFHIYWIDSLSPIPEFRVSVVKQTCRDMLRGDTYVVRVGAVDAQLYYFSDHYHMFNVFPRTYPFTVFDPKRDTWEALPTPPFILGESKYRHYNVMFLKETRRILGWRFDFDQKSPVFCFDTTKPRNGWIGLGTIFPFTGGPVPCFFHHNHPGFGDIYIFFSYFPNIDPLKLSVSYLSNNMDAFRSINQPIVLPRECTKYLFYNIHNDSDDESEYSDLELEFDDAGLQGLVADMKIVHLGSQRFGVFMHRYKRNSQGKKTGFILYLTFKYDIVTTIKDSKPTLEIQALLLDTRRFKFHAQEETTNVSINGAFLL